MTDTRVMDLPGGRQLAWIELGDPAGPVVIGMHGTPGSSRQIAIDEKAILDAGVRLVCPDRPGYGLSTYQPGRSLVGWVEDVRALADRLVIERFSVMGVSGGGPHAAACACLLADRVRAAGLVSGVGPLDRPGAEEGMLSFNKIMTRAARRAPALMLPLYAVMTAAGRRWPERSLDAFARQLPRCDAEVLARPAVRAAFADNLRHASRASGRAALQDFALFAR
ncbi:MAG TPA: alpha/beta hydrolase, partial [Acidimicrobiales bacterium]|nr:alpha/beta hydrolase [Acidimicrobiales bacterium]